MAKLTENELAPNFTLPSSEGRPLALKEFRGQSVIVHFYPQDDVFGANEELLGLKKIYDEILDNGAVVLGISPDDLLKHKNFIAKFDLPFTLLSDLDHSVAKIYGVWIEKKDYGKKHWGFERAIFIIDSKGILKAILKRLKPEENVQAALEWSRQLAEQTKIYKNDTESELDT